MRRTETVAGMLTPVGIFHRFGQDISSQEAQFLTAMLPRSIQTYLAGMYNSRFQALEDWFRTPFQWEKLHHVLRQGRRPRPDWFVYRETFISLAPEYVLEALPAAKIIYIYRDGRDVANSLVESYNVLTDDQLKNLKSTEMRLGRPYDNRYVPWWVQEGRDEEFIQSSPYVRAIWMWAYMAKRCHEYFSSLDASVRSAQVLEIQYEGFMQAPHETGTRICSHLETDRTRAFERHLDAARTSSIGKHEHRPITERQAAEDVAGPVLKKLDYALTAMSDSRVQN